MLLNFLKKQKGSKYDFMFKPLESTPSSSTSSLNIERTLVDLKNTHNIVNLFEFLNNVPKASDMVKSCIQSIPTRIKLKQKLSISFKDVKHDMKCMVDGDTLFVKYDVSGLTLFPKEIMYEHVDDTYCIIVFDAEHNILFQNNLCTRLFGNWKHIYVDNHLNFIDNVILENTDFLNYIKDGISSKKNIYETCIKMVTIINLDTPKCSFDRYDRYDRSDKSDRFSTISFGFNYKDVPFTGFFNIRLIPNESDDNVVMMLKSCNSNMIQNTSTLRTTINIVSSMLPKHVVHFLCNKQITEKDLSILSRNHDNIVILFTDIVHWTTICDNTTSSITMSFLNTLYTIYDDLAEQHNIYKLETVGDCYVGVSGLTKQDKNGNVELLENDDFNATYVSNMVKFAKQLLISSHLLSTPDGNPLQIRIGIHVGSVSSGVIGYTMPKFVLTGDAMNTASRMESTCDIGCIQITKRVYDYLDRDNRQLFVCNRDVFVKGKGLMDVYVLKL